MLVALERLPGQRVLVSDDDGYTVHLSLDEWRDVLRLPTGQQRAAVEKIVDQRDRQENDEC